jgi:hypothetical protein
MFSPSKATDLMNYLRSYPHWPLRLDLLVDFLMHPQMIVPQPGVPIFSERDMQRSPWNHSFEDLINTGAIAFPNVDYMSRDEEAALLKVMLAPDAEPDLSHAPLDFALTIRHALRERVPLQYRAKDVELLERGEIILNRVYEQWGFHAETDDNLAVQPEDEARVARWIFQLQMPRVFARSDQRAEEELKTYFGWQENEAVWLDPAALASLLKDREPLDQFRAHVQTLAERGFNERQTAAYVAEQKYAMEDSRTIADFSFDAIELVLDVVPLPFKSIAAKVARRALAHRSARPNRWLLNTSEIDASG